MAEIGGDSSRRSVETVVTPLSDAPVPAEGDGAVPENAVVDNEQIYHSIRHMRSMAVELSVKAAQTGNGMYAFWAHEAMGAAGLMRVILAERGSRYADMLNEEEATQPNSAGTRQLPLR